MNLVTSLELPEGTLVYDPSNVGTIEVADDDELELTLEELQA